MSKTRDAIRKAVEKLDSQIEKAEILAESVGSTDRWPLLLAIAALPDKDFLGVAMGIVVSEQPPAAARAAATRYYEAHKPK